MLQTALANEIGEPVVCGKCYLVACFLEPLTEARERRDITSRTRCHDQKPHQEAMTALARRSASTVSVTSRSRSSAAGTMS